MTPAAHTLEGRLDGEVWRRDYLDVTTREVFPAATLRPTAGRAGWHVCVYPMRQGATPMLSTILDIPGDAGRAAAMAIIDALLGHEPLHAYAALPRVHGASPAPWEGIYFARNGEAARQMLRQRWEASHGPDAPRALTRGVTRLLPIMVRAIYAGATSLPVWISGDNS